MAVDVRRRFEVLRGIEICSSPWLSPSGHDRERMAATTTRGRFRGFGKHRKSWWPVYVMESHNRPTNTYIAHPKQGPGKLRITLNIPFQALFGPHSPQGLGTLRWRNQVPKFGPDVRDTLRLRNQVPKSIM